MVSASSSPPHPEVVPLNHASTEFVTPNFSAMNPNSSSSSIASITIQIISFVALFAPIFRRYKLTGIVDDSEPCPPPYLLLASLWRDLGIGPKPEPQVSTFISDKRVDESSSEEEDEEVQGEADDEEAEEAEGEAGEAEEEEDGDDEEEEDGDDEDEDEGDEDEGDGDEDEEEEGDDFGHWDEEEHLTLVIYRVTLEDEHYLTSLQIEDYANSNDLHEAVLDLIVEHGHLDYYDDIPLEDYSIFYLQELGYEIFLRLDREELDWGWFREVVHRVAACDGGLVLDVYLREEGNQLVGWKGIPLSTCGENVDILDEMVKAYFIQHANEDADAYTFVYYTKLEDKNEIWDGQERELSLETDWQLFSHLLRGVVAVKDGDLEDYAWQDGEEIWIPWKPQEGEDRFLVAVCYMAPNGLRFYMPDLLIDSDVNSRLALLDRLRAHYERYHEDTIILHDAPVNFEMYQLRYCIILEDGVEEHLNNELDWDEMHNLLNLVILEDVDEG